MPPRPPKEFMDAAISSIAAAGTAENPAAVAAAQWRRMGAKARSPWEALRRLRERGVRPEGNPGPTKGIVATAAAPEAAIPLAAAKTVAGIVTGDLVVIHSTIPRGTKKKPLPPLEVEYHVNLASLGIGAVGIALAALVGIVAWEGVQSAFGPVFPGIKDIVQERKTGSESPSSDSRRPWWLSEDSLGWQLIRGFLGE